MHPKSIAFRIQHRPQKLTQNKQILWLPSVWRTISATMQGSNTKCTAVLITHFPKKNSFLCFWGTYQRLTWLSQGFIVSPGKKWREWPAALFAYFAAPFGFQGLKKQPFLSHVARASGTGCFPKISWCLRSFSGNIPGISGNPKGRRCASEKSLHH